MQKIVPKICPQSLQSIKKITDFFKTLHTQYIRSYNEYKKQLQFFISIMVFQGKSYYEGIIKHINNDLINYTKDIANEHYLDIHYYFDLFKIFKYPQNQDNLPFQNIKAHQRKQLAGYFDEHYCLVILHYFYSAYLDEQPFILRNIKQSKFINKSKVKFFSN